MALAIRITRLAASSCDVAPSTLRSTLQALRDSAGYGSWAVGCWVASDRTVARLNQRYRGVAGPTDVLSFSPHVLSAPEAFAPVEADAGGVRDLGDIIIAAAYVRAACERAALDEREHYETLLCHGLVHLLGYDHETDAQHAVMAAREEGLLQQLRRERRGGTTGAGG